MTGKSDIKLNIHNLGVDSLGINSQFTNTIAEAAQKAKAEREYNTSKEKTVSLFEEKKRLKEQINFHAREYAKKTDKEYNALHKLWKLNGGKSISKETVAELRVRLKFYKSYTN